MFRLRHVPAGVVGAFSLVFSGLAHAQVAEPTDEEGVKLRFQGGVNAVVERNLFWRFAETVAQAEDFTSDTEWLEAYVKPGLSYQRTTDSGATLYGGLSVVGSWTAGNDAFGAGDTGRVSWKKRMRAYASVRGASISIFRQDLRNLKRARACICPMAARTAFLAGL